MNKPATTLAVVAFLAGCATVPPEREERDRAILAALEPCRQQYSGFFHVDTVRVNQDGRIGYVYRDDMFSMMPAVHRCISEALKDLKVGPFAPGRLAANARPASVSVGISGKAVVVPVRVNGVAGLMLLSTGSALTYVRPAYAQRAGLETSGRSPTAHVRLEGQNVVIPFVRARSVEVGGVSVEALDIAVHEPRALTEKVNGVLGGNFLSHFKVNVDRGSKRLTLEPLRPATSSSGRLQHALVGFDR